MRFDFRRGITRRARPRGKRLSDSYVGRRGWKVFDIKRGNIEFFS
jgi:hypothetical protein